MKSKNFMEVIMDSSDDLLNTPNFDISTPYTNQELTALVSVMIGVLDELFKKMGVGWEDDEKM